MESDKHLTNNRRGSHFRAGVFLLQTGTIIGALTTFTLTARLAAHGAVATSAQRSVSIPEANSRFFRFANIADTHIIDDFYKGFKGNSLDTETIFKTTIRLETCPVIPTCGIKRD